MNDHELFEQWWLEQTRSGDPARRLNLQRDAFIAGMQAARATPADHSVPVAWQYENAYGNPFLTHTDPSTWHPHDRAGFKNFVALYAKPPQKDADHIEAQSVPVAWLHDALEYIKEGIESEGPLEAEHSIEARRLISTAPQAPQSNAQSVRDAWISVDERLPNERENVLVFRPDAHHLPACDPNIDVRNYFGNGVFNGIHKVTHWQPLPAPPQKPVSDEVKP